MEQSPSGSIASCDERQDLVREHGSMVSLRTMSARWYRCASAPNLLRIALKSRRQIVQFPREGPSPFPERRFRLGRFLECWRENRCSGGDRFFWEHEVPFVADLREGVDHRQ